MREKTVSHKSTIIKKSCIKFDIQMAEKDIRHFHQCIANMHKVETGLLYLLFLNKKLFCQCID